MGVVTVAELKPIISGKRSFRPSSSARHITVFPLVSRSGRIRKLLLEAKDTKISRLNLTGLPGGFDAFELAAKFCYGMNVEITISNVALLRCAARFMEMTEDIFEKNLEIRTEVFLKDTVFPNISNSIYVLHHCETLLPVAEEVNLVSQLINAIANNASKEQLTSGFLDSGTPPDWWRILLAVLNLDFFQRVLSAVKSKGLKQDIISRILINYAQNSLQGLFIKDTQLVKGSSLYLDLQKRQRIIVETIASLLPTQSTKSSVTMAFLSSLLKSAIAASASTSCRSDLERRIGLQLDQAILEDILIPANPHGNTHSPPLYDIDSILRIFSFFLNLDEDDEEDNPLRDESEMVYGFDSPGSPKHSSIIKVSKLLDNYLAAIHPNIKDSERYRLCKTIDCQKLSQEACSQAAQNERLPVQMAVQVLYFEQIRLRNAMNGGHNQFFGSNSQLPQRSGSGEGSGCISPRDNYASVARIRMRLTDLEKDHVSMKQELVKSHPANKLFKSFTNKLSKINALFRIRDLKPLGGKVNSESRLLFQKRRRHSVS
ncbi:unnamed protein product [Withania somnifera]